ncbi:MAG: ATP-binding cassette domain-containing protein [Rhodovibrionaceae bacterium]
MTAPEDPRHRVPPTSEGDFRAPILPGRLEAVSYEIAGKRLIDGITLDIEAGTRTIVLGPNGAGKSLTLRLAHGLIKPTSGAVFWRNRKTEGAGAAPRRQAMVFQRPVMLRRSAAANIDYALALHGFARAERRRRRDAALARTGLTAAAAQPARTLSGGEQQRLALARAWALEPQVLFLDEPTASLDPSATRQVEEIVAAIAASGTKIVMTTHDLGQAKRLADEVVFLHNGRLLERSPAADFFETPRSKEAQAFLSGELLW